MTDTTKAGTHAEQPLAEKLKQYKSVADLARAVMVKSTTLSRDHMEQAARAYLVSYLNGDLETRAALFAEDAIFEDPVGSKPFRGKAEIMKFWQGAKEIRWWAAHDLRRVTICGNEVMLHFISTMKVPGLEKAAMEVFELQVFNDAGKITQVRVFFDEDSVLS